MTEKADGDAVAEPILLASASPRRRELLGRIGVRFEVVTSRFDEDSLRHLADDPGTFVRAAATGKAEEVAVRRGNGVILGVDTDVVSPEERVLGKPVDFEDACRMLRMLSGRTHRVLSGVCLLRVVNGEICQRDLRVAETRVTFSDLSEAAIRAYAGTGEPMDKAGAYGIQTGGIALVARVDGDLSNVIGLPLPTLTAMLANFGVPLWNFPGGEGVV